MSFRHFKRRAVTSSEKESSSADEHDFDEDIHVLKKSVSVKEKSSTAESIEETPKNDTNQDDEESNDGETEAGSESEESSDCSSTSENGDIIPLQRPLFLKKVNKNKQRAPTIDKDQNESDTHAEQKKKFTVMKRIDKANQAAQKHEIMRLHFDTNYSTNEELIKQCMLLNDNDYVDPEKERLAWLKRQEERSQRYRNAQLAKQQLLEQYEANKFASMQKDKDRHSRFEVATDTGKEQVTTMKQTSTEKSKKSYDNNRYKVTRAKNIEFRKNSAHENENDKNDAESESEYSII
ncbi:hypothetical protein SEUBUCD646_0D03600 [Saccharomyces eubayanus]|uniref:Uncharacterized protein n=2 Tax=Saccharomyces TaxID=4930 RepID=A0A6C1E4Q1_SACPS|nr:SPP381-like protein [Saccharomyces eubayanus]KOH00469.1 SPP381-like protein [Saccharomyces eubayanus]QID84326.1 hypothetical protein GRS66_006827 [Saccharomyces pastorianus]CAI1921538.1 hypothetical protein SEUBUCD650_0D03590 [Saccharomyces eubayanus]CAI1953928.1 hypothetical protein SEUBUCD646_0D03600 [Saccharomyces eubayanus]